MSKLKKNIKKSIKILGMMIMIFIINMTSDNDIYAAIPSDFPKEQEAVLIITHMSVPENFMAYRNSDTSIRLEWEGTLFAQGYYIYRYDSSLGKYVKIHTVIDPDGYRETLQWIDEGLETNQIYQYKISAYTIENGKKFKSKLSDWVSAKTYTQNSREINAKAPEVNIKKIFLKVGSKKKISAKIVPSNYGTNKKKKAFSTKVRWYTSDTSIAKISRGDVITAGKKTGKCNVYARAHNGAQTAVKIVVRKSLEKKYKEFGAPDYVRAYRHSDTAVRLQWEMVLGGDGYIIYKYDSSSKKYVKIHTVTRKTESEWIDSGLKTNQIYQYKIASYKKKDGKKQISNLSGWVSAKTYKRNNKKINAKAPKLSKQKVYLGLCSSKQITAKIAPSKYGTNDNKKVFSEKIRWYSSNSSIATVDKKGKITAGKKKGKCKVYAVSHNGARTKVDVIVKNYAKVKKYYSNTEKDNDILALITDYKKQIQNIAEYYSINRVKEKESILFELNDDAIVTVIPANADIGNLAKDIETLLVDFPYYVSVEVVCDSVIFKLKKENSAESPTGYVQFFFDRNCNEWEEIQIASHWTSYRFYPD